MTTDTNLPADESKWVDAPEYGKKAKREIREGYTPSTELPGATVIPSRRDKYGAQLGQNPHEQFAVVVDPGYPDSFVWDPRKISAEAAAKAITGREPANVLANTRAQAEAQEDAVIDRVQEARERHRAAVGGKGFRSPPPLPPRRYKPDEETTQPLDPPVPAVAEDTVQPSAGEPLSTGEGMSEFHSERVIPQALKQLAETNPDVTRELRNLMKTLAAAAGHPQEKESANAGIEEPSVEVQVAIPGYGTVTSAYSYVVEDRVALILVLDKRSRSGQRFTPEPSDDKVYTISVKDLKAENTAPTSYRAYYPGISFSFMHWSFFVFLIDYGEAGGNEEHEG